MAAYTLESSPGNSNTSNTSSPQSECTDNANLVISPIFFDAHSPIVNTNETHASVSFHHHLPTRATVTIPSASPPSETSSTLSPPKRIKQHGTHLSVPHRYDNKELPDYTTKPSAKLPHCISSRNHTSPANDVDASQSPPTLYKSIHVLDAKSISHNMERSTQQRQAGNLKHHTHTEDLQTETPTSPSHPHTKHYHHFLSTNAPLPPTPVSRPLHPFYRHSTISGLLHSNTPAPSTLTNEASDSLWQDICVRVLPLFNGQGVQGAVEDMNDLLRQCLSDPISPQLYHHIESLLHDGMFTLNTKLFGVTDEKLLDRLVEQWSFFFTYALPYFEAVFLPLRTDIHYQSEAERWNVRNMALQSFRDNVILPQTKRLEDVFHRLFTDTGSSQNPVATAAKMLQMVSLLASAPDSNEEIDRVLAKLKTLWQHMMRKGGCDWQAGTGEIQYGSTLKDDVLV